MCNNIAYFLFGAQSFFLWKWPSREVKKHGLFQPIALLHFPPRTPIRTLSRQLKTANGIAWKRIEMPFLSQ